MTHTRWLMPLLFLSTISHADCPSTDEGWRIWAGAAISTFAGSGFRAAELEPAAEEWESCSASLAEHPKAAACLDRFARFARAVTGDSRHGHSLGLAISDEDYFASAPYPDMLELPDRLKDRHFLELLDHNDDPKAIEEAVAWVNGVNATLEPRFHWVVFPYQSQHLSTPDGTEAYGRFFILVPGRDYDRYFQFGLRDEPDKALPHGLSVAAVQKTDPSTHRPLAHPQVRLKDFWRLRPSDGSYPISTRLKETGHLENCYTCHKDAVLPIHPLPGRFDAKQFGDALALVNDRITGLGRAEYFGLSADDYGPGLGPEESPLRTTEFLKACAGGAVTAPNRLKRLGEAMSCAKCHNGKRRGVLNYPTGIRRLSIGETLPWHYVVDEKLMPPESDDLSHEERQALYDCVKAELYGGSGDKPGLLRQWLENSECWR